MSIQEIKVPDIGHFTGVEVIEVAIQKGALINAEDTLITLETEKAAMDVPSPVRGQIQEVKLKVGDKVSQGDVIALIEIGEQAKKAETKEEVKDEIKKEEVKKEEVKKEVKEESVKAQEMPVHAGPATRRLARELGVDLTQVTGSGHRQRIVTKDVYAFAQGSAETGWGIEKAPEIDFSRFGKIEVKPLGRIKKWTAKNLHRNWVSIPHVTQFDEADITELEQFREECKKEAERQQIKLTPLSFIIKATVSALKAYPQFNASLAANGSDLILKKYCHIGVAVDTPNGLVVPVLRDADTKGLLEIAKELGILSQLAREGKLKAEQMQGNCFSITSLGGVGGTAFTPIINAPDVAILGLSKAQIKPLYLNNQFVPRRMLPLSLSYDHRVIDGVEAAKFITHLSAQLHDIRKLLL